MKNKRTYLIIILSISLVGSIISGIFIGIISSNSSWIYHLTDSFEQQNSGTSISNNGEYFVVGSDNDNLYLFKRTSSTPLWNFRSTGDISRVDISADSNIIIAGGQDRIVHLFDRGSSIPIKSFTTSYEILCVALSSDGEYSLVCDQGKNLYLYQRSTSTLLINGYNAGDYGVISYDGSYFASFDFMEGNIYFFNKSSSTPIWQYSIGDVLYDIAISSNGEFIVTGGQAPGHKIYLFNRSSSTPKLMYTEGTMRSVAISQDGRYIAIGCADGIYLFNSSSLTRLWKYSFPIYGDTNSIAISSYGDYIVADLWDYDEEFKHLLIFNKLSSTPIWILDTESLVNDIDISLDGNHISVSTQRKAWYIDLRNPLIDDFFQLKLNISYISLGSFIGFGIIGSLIYAIISHSTKTRIEKEAQKKQILEVIETLDEKYQEWENKESEEDNKI